ncbi:hypothetical protein BJX65DRAFT_20197 [Aspergillus insuetus]
MTGSSFNHFADLDVNKTCNLFYDLQLHIAPVPYSLETLRIDRLPKDRSILFRRPQPTSTVLFLSSSISLEIRPIYTKPSCIPLIESTASGACRPRDEPRFLAPFKPLRSADHLPIVAHLIRRRISGGSGTSGGQIHGATPCRSAALADGLKYSSRFQISPFLFPLQA